MYAHNQTNSVPTHPMLKRTFDPLCTHALTLLAAVLLIGTLAACDDGNPASDNGEDEANDLTSASNPILVVLEPQGQDMTFVNYTAASHHMTICYDDGECDSEDSGGSGVGGESRTILTSDSDRNVVGVEVDVLVEDAPGKLIVGESATADPGGMNPDLNTVFHETDVLDPGDEVAFEIGDLE